MGCTPEHMASALSEAVRAKLGCPDAVKEQQLVEMFRAIRALPRPPEDGGRPVSPVTPVGSTGGEHPGVRAAVRVLSPAIAP